MPDGLRLTAVDSAKELENELAEEAGQGVGSSGCRVQAAGICKVWFASRKLTLELGVFVSEPPQEELEANPELKEGVEPEEAKMETIETNEVREVQLAESPSELQQNPFKSGWVWESLKCGPFHFIEDEVFSAGLKLPAWKHARTRQNYRSRKMIEVQSTVQIPVIWGSEGFYADSTNPFSLYNSTSEPRMRRRGNHPACLFSRPFLDSWLYVRLRWRKMTRLMAGGHMHELVIQSGSCLDFTLLSLSYFFDRFP